MEISIVSPVYKAEKIISELIQRLHIVLKPITADYEIILVEDGSSDGSWNIINEICKTDRKVKGIKLSKNFGQHYAITAGLDNAEGKWVVVMDCDLQDRPEEIHSLYHKAKEGNEIVLARRMERKDGLLKKISSRIFYRILSYLTGTYQDASVANFGIYNSKVIIELRRLREPIRYFPTMVKWVGFKKTYLNVEHGARFEGNTTYNWNRLIKLSMDIILANSDKPIRLIVKTGILISLASFLFGITVIIRYFLHQIIVPGYTSLLVSIWFLGGMILMVLGLLGLYIGKIFEGVKNRPIYVTDVKLNCDSH